MFAYPSGHAHVGHVRNYMIGDVVARMKRMRGFNVLHPFGWDAFGLPAENAAIKNGTHPETWTLENIAHMKGQLQRIGISYAWEREIATCLPDYYHWNQWLFLKMLERDLAYRKRSNVNWCPSCNTVLANEQVVDGGCWRCGTPVTVRELEQWFFRITQLRRRAAGGGRAAAGLARKSSDDAAELDRAIGGRSRAIRARTVSRSGDSLELASADADAEPTSRSSPPASTRSTARTSCCWRPSIRSCSSGASEPGGDAFRQRRSQRFQAQDRTARMTGEIEKEGFDTGRTAINPFTDESRCRSGSRTSCSVEYGTGAVMGVPGHDQRDFEFARKYSLPITVVVQPADGARARRRTAMTRGVSNDRACWCNSGELSTGCRPIRRATRLTDGRGRSSGHRRGHGPVPAEGLGHLAAALLGHADSGGLLREVRHGAGAGRTICRCCCRRSPSSRGRGDSPLAQIPEFVNADVSRLRRTGAARDRHDGHVRRFVLVFLPLLRSARTPSCRSIRRRSATGARSTSTAAASSTRSCT